MEVWVEVETEIAVLLEDMEVRLEVQVFGVVGGVEDQEGILFLG